MSIQVNCLNPIANVGLDLFTEDYVISDSYETAEAVLVRSAAMHDMELSDKLLAVARAGAGVNNIPLDKCAEKGIVVFNTPGANANGVKELAIAGMLLAARDIAAVSYTHLDVYKRQVSLYCFGSNDWCRKYFRSCYCAGTWWTGSYFLDVGFCFSWYDDELCRKYAWN